jgi:hypothetical protein
LVFGLITPSLILFATEVVVGRVGAGTALADVLRRQFAEGENLFLLALLGLIPFAVLSIVCFFAAKRMTGLRLTCLGGGGLLGILGLMVPAHFAVWYPHYSGQRGSSTEAITFVIVPFLCLASLILGLLIGWAVSRLPFARR